LIRPVIQIKPIKGDALLADRDDNQVGSDQPIKSVAIHAQVIRRIT
jgi:hypothetical protein